MEYNGYDIVTADNSNYKKIKSIGKGSIPVVLTGVYTSEGEARKAIDLQKSVSTAARKVNAKKQSNG